MMDPIEKRAYIPMTAATPSGVPLELSAEVAEYYRRRWNLIVLEPTSATGARHPDTGEPISIGMFQIEREAVERYPELARLDAVELVVIGSRARAFRPE